MCSVCDMNQLQNGTQKQYTHQTRLHKACTTSSNSSSASPRGLSGRSRSSLWSSRWAVLRIPPQSGLNLDFLAALRLSSPRNGAGDVLAVGATKPKLSTCGHVWCPAVAWTQPHLTDPLWDVVLWDLTKNLPLREGPFSQVSSYICFLLHVAQVPKPTPTAR